MTQSRRCFVKNGVAVATSLSVAKTFVPTESLFAESAGRRAAVPSIEDPTLKANIQRALDAARSVKADYADIRVTHSFNRDFAFRNVHSVETMGVGVRAMVNGYWGFASGPICDADELVRLAKAATTLAHSASTAYGRPNEVQLVDRPVVRDGHWTTPIKIDPFTIHPSYYSDHLGRAISNYVTTRPNGLRTDFNVGFTRVEKAVGATDGTYFTQRLYTSGGNLSVVIFWLGRQIRGSSDIFPMTGAGYELFDEVALRAEVDRVVEAIRFEASLPGLPVDVGRFDTVFAAHETANLISTTIAAPAQLDRALGFEANAAGTSFLDDPDQMIGSYRLASPLISVTGDRTMPGGIGTVAWDDDGVVPAVVPIVTNGVLTNYLTSRDVAGVARTALPVYGKTLTSNGCAQSPSAIEAPLVHTPNLTLQPSDSQKTFSMLCEDMGNGIAIGGGVIGGTAHPDMDQQLLNGYISGDIARLYAIKNGKISGTIQGAAILFRTPEFWKSVKAIGGAASAQRFAVQSTKGQPGQTTHHTVSAVPVLVEKLTYIDAKRKA